MIHDTGKALSLLAHQLGRVVYYRLKRQTAFMALFLQASGSRAREPDAELDVTGLSLK
jgi:hypothetical protein